MTLPREPLRGVVYPPPDVVSHYAAQGVPVDRVLASELCQSFARHHSRTAITGGEGKMTYGELDRATDALAYVLHGLGLMPLDRAVFQMSNSTDLLISLIGCWKAGVIPICTLATHREAEIGYLAQHGGATGYFVQAADSKFDYPAFALQMQARVPSIKHIVTGGASSVPGTTSLRQAITSVDPVAAKAHVERMCASLDPMQPVVFQLSGGTTGVPKIIPRLNFEYLYNMQSVFDWNDRVSDEVVFCAGPMVHNAGMVCHWGPSLLRGGTIIVDNVLTVEGLRDILAQHHPTWMFVPRPLIGRMKQAMADLDFDASDVKGVVTASNTKTVREELGLPGLHIFGMAEGLIMTTRIDDPVDALEVSVGRPVSRLDEVLIVKPGTTEPVAIGETGELICRGPYTIRGYYDAEDRNKDAFTADGFYRSGDLLSTREVGGNIYFVFEGRLKDVINRGGEKISCDEIERAIRGFPGMYDIALVAMPDEVYVERGCAFVCMESGHSAPTVAALGLYLQAKGIAKYKWPERVQLIETMPTTSSAKISKPLLRQMITDILREESALTKQSEPLSAKSTT